MVGILVMDRIRDLCVLYKFLSLLPTRRLGHGFIKGHTQRLSHQAVSGSYEHIFPFASRTEHTEDSLETTNIVRLYFSHAS